MAYKLYENFHHTKISRYTVVCWGSVLLVCTHGVPCIDFNCVPCTAFGGSICCWEFYFILLLWNPSSSSSKTVQHVRNWPKPFEVMHLITNEYM